MKKILYLLLALFTVSSAIAQETKSEIKTRIDVIRNESVAGANTKTRIANAYQELADGMISIYPITASGTDTYTGSLQGLDAYSGRIVFVVFPNNNTGAATMNIGGIGAANIQKYDGGWTALEADDIIANKLYRLYHDGTRFQIDLGGTGGAAVLADGDYGSVTVSGTGTVITLDDGAVTSGKIASDVALAGSQTTTTQSQADNSTKIATTAYVDTGLSGKQASDADLTTIAGLTATTDNFLQAKSSAWASRTVAQVKTDLGLTGTNSGDQTITLTGAVTGSGTGSFATALVVYAFPETYGAVGDGSTDDATALQSCIDSGKPCFQLPRKNYRINTGLTIGDGEALIGGDWTSILSTTSNITMVTIAGKTARVEGIQLLGNDAGAAQTGIAVIGNAGLTLDYTSNIISKVYFKDLNFAGLYIYRVLGTTGSVHQGAVIGSDCFFDSCPGTAVYLDDRAEYNEFSNFDIYACGVGYRVGAGNNSVTGGSIEDGTTGVLFFTGSNDGKCIFSGVKMNHLTTTVSQTTAVSLGSKFIGCEMIVGAITMSGSGHGHQWIGNMIGSSNLSFTNISNMDWIGNTFQTLPTVTISGGSNNKGIGNTFPTGAGPANWLSGLNMNGSNVVVGVLNSSSAETAQLTVTGQGTTSSTTNVRWRNSANTTLGTLLDDGTWLTAYQGTTSLARTFVSHTPGSLSATSGSNSVVGQTIIGTLNTTSTYSGGSYTFLDLAGSVTSTIGLSVNGIKFSGGLTASTGTSNYTGSQFTPVLNTTSTHASGKAIGYRWAPTETSLTGLAEYPFLDESTSGLNGFGTATPAVRVDIVGGLATRATSPAQITSNQNDYAIGAGSFFRLSTDASRNITSMTGGVDGKNIVIVNVGAQNIVFTHDDGATGTAANRITSSTGASITVAPNGSVTFIYDATTQRWRDIAFR
jgi:hypothetical protein